MRAKKTLLVVLVLAMSALFVGAAAANGGHGVRDGTGPVAEARGGASAERYRGSPAEAPEPAAVAEANRLRERNQIQLREPDEPCEPEQLREQDRVREQEQLREQDQPGEHDPLRLRDRDQRRSN